MRKKELRVMAVAGIVSAVLLGTTAFAAASNISGFEKVKEAGFKLYQTTNFSFDANIKLIIDGETIQEQTTSQKREDTRNYSRINIDDIGVNKVTTGNFLQDGKSIFLDQDGSYTMYDYDGFISFGNEETMTDNQEKLVNVLIDTVVGDVKNYFYMNDRTVSLNLDGSQIPELAQLFTSVATEAMGEAQSNPDVYMEDDFPVPVANTIIDSVVGEVELDEQGNIKNVSGSATIIGNDKDGVSHSYVFEFSANIYDIGTTVSDKIDMDNVTVINGDRLIFQNTVEITQTQSDNVEFNIDVAE